MEESNQFKILTIDDESYIRQSIRNYLEDYGFKVVEAENGCQGVEVFETERPDLVVLDLRMPQMDGLELLEKIREKDPEIPMVVASGTGNISAVVEALHQGAWDYILKPIEDMSVLYHSIKKCLKQSQLKKENRQYQEKLEELVNQRTVELRESEHRYRAVFENAGTAVIIVEPDDTISMANSKFSEFAAMQTRDIVDTKKWYDFIHPEDIDLMRNQISRTTGKTDAQFPPTQYEIRFMDSRGEEKFVYVSVGNIPGTKQAVLSLLDITERKRAEYRWRSLEKQLRKAQKMEAIGTLAGGIAHDLNNILSPVLGYSDMIMKSSAPDSAAYSRSEKIQKAALRAADLVSQILSFNRNRSDTRRRITVHPVLGEAVKLLRGSIPATIRIEDRIDRHCGMIDADPTHIHQVILNLCTNAYHAMEEEGGVLTVGLEQVTLSLSDMMEYPGLTHGPGEYLRMAVADTGCGMADDILERIFDPYFTTKAEGKGTGLGLATVYSIIKSCKGDIQVNSSLNKGTTFAILLPVISGAEAKEGRGSRSQRRKSAAGETILLVDDDPDIVEMCTEGLEMIGYRVISFPSGTQALDYFTKNHHTVDLVVTDQTMPGKTGFDLAGEMLSVKGDLPVVLCSGYAGGLSKKKVEAAGIKRFMIKPVTVDDLADQIQQLLNNNT